MTELVEVTDGIYQISLLRPPRGCLIYFIADKQTALIETGPAVVIPALLEAIRQLGYDPAQLSYVFLTHIHLDHAGGVGTLTQQFPQVKVFVHPRGARHLLDPSRLIVDTRRAYGERFEDEYGFILPVPEGRVRTVEDGEVISLGNRELRIIYAPGHCAHQMCFYDPKSEGLFSGDAIAAFGSNILLPGVDSDLNAILETHDKLLRLNLKIVFTSHRGVLSNELTEHIQAVRANTKSCGDIILEAMRGGEEQEEIVRKLDTHQREFVSSEYWLGESEFDRVISWYRDYFKRKGLASPVR